ncbi:MAG: carbamate kinase [Euryarchaeota archaeon CG01_land_8_20_14_3_00_38_12]|nr:MAG: carbamate kinase [Euryarchaeota archaeon CG01_land_8_20_14_3_00_38_12]PJB21511.1 MAG: carbamate kinase [Euryarchaeota archaeon CG_4_9_14_3_um_filter_38_12]
MGKKAVIAIGGNSILRAEQKGTIQEQFANTIETAEHVADMIMMGYELVITHGNGPQVGNMLLMSEKTEEILYPLLLDICDSNTQGSMGYMIQQTLGNVLKKRKIKKSVVTVVTQVVVDRNDSAFKKPTKPIGSFYSKENAEKYRKEKKWDIIEDAGRGYRRVVPSPEPLEIVENEVIQKLVDDDVIVIAVGGGGIPVVKEKNFLKGVEAVIDKDLASSLLASNINAELLLISTNVEKVFLNYNKPNQKGIDRMTVKDAKKYLSEGHFPPGSMGPKIEAGIRFLEKGGKEVIITSPECIGDALKNKTGTHIIR